MSNSIKCLLLTPLIAALFCPAAHAQGKARTEPLAAQVKAKIDRGVDFLRRSQRPGGHWEVDVLAVEFRGGGTALAVLALLNCGVSVDDKAVSSGLKFLRDLKPDHTYVRALQTMAYAEARKTEDLQRIQQNVDWLLDGRITDGQGNLLGWGYGKTGDAPRMGPDNSNSQYALLGLWAGKLSGANIDDKVWQQIREFYRHTQNPEDGSWGYTNRAPGTLTMTTAGLCGLLIAGMETHDGREKLNKDNGTTIDCGVYQENPEIARALTWIGRNIRFDEPRATYYNLYGIERAGRLSGQRFFNNHDWYREGCEFLVKQQSEDGSWAKTLSPLDRWPVINSSFALLFLSKGRTPILISKVVHTEGAILPRNENDTDWNNDRNDLRHLSQFVSKELFNGLPLAWQTFDLRAGDLQNVEGKLVIRTEFNILADKLEKLRVRLDSVKLKENERTQIERQIESIEKQLEPALMDLVSEMLQSPIMYISGHKSPLNRFSPVERELLRRYVDNGGFIIAEACCGRAEFDQGFKALAQKLWPASPLIDLDAGHPVWTTKFNIKANDPYQLMGINMGCKTVLIYSPPQNAPQLRQNISCQWEADFNPKSGLSDRAFKLGANIIAYATGLEAPQPRLTQVEVAAGRDASDIPRGYFKAGQLKHEGDWHPAPKAMFNLMDHMRKHSGLDVALKTEELTVNSKSVIDYKFVYMHGRAEFHFEPAELTNLRFNLENGGLLFADACCGKEAFDKSFRKFAAELFPSRKLEDIPLDDILFSEKLNGVKLDENTIKCRTKAAGGEEAGLMRKMPPMLEGIKIDNRWVVIYSKYDIGCALERHRSSDCLGYDTDSAFKIAGAAVLYLLKLQ
jgi:hypothetical protein